MIENSCKEIIIFYVKISKWIIYGKKQDKRLYTWRKRNIGKQVGDEGITRCFETLCGCLTALLETESYFSWFETSK